MTWNLHTACVLARNLQLATYSIGYYVALGGGVIHKDGERPDLDIVIVPRSKRSRPVEPREVLLETLANFGIEIEEDKGWLLRGNFYGECIDIRLIAERPAP